jgi:ribosome-binding factor A
MANYRRGRINDEMRKTLCEILRNVKDPRVARAFVSITAVDVTPDLKYAKIYFSSLGGDASPAAKKEILQGLRSCSGFLRHELAVRLNLRITPELAFYEDTSIAYGAKIAKILNGIEISDPDPEDEMPEPEEVDSAEDDLLSSDEED